MNANIAMQGAMEKGTEVMTKLNKTINPAQQQKMAQQFMVENDKMSMQDEMFNDLFDRSYISMCLMLSLCSVDPVCCSLDFRMFN